MINSKFLFHKHRMVLFLLLMLGCVTQVAADDVSVAPDAGNQVKSSTLEALQSLVTLKANLKSDISNLSKEANSSLSSETEKSRIVKELEKLEDDYKTTTINLENIAAGTDISSLSQQKEEKFNIQEELFALLKPAIDEMKDMTARIRQKSDLKEKISYYANRLEVLESALKNVKELQQQSDSKELNSALSDLETAWRKKHAFMESELQSARFQLNKLLGSEATLAEASQSYLKSFFQKRGLYLTEALFTVVVILFLSRFSYNAMQRYIPGFRKKHRSFKVRLLELVHRLVTILLIILGPMIVFYLVEDWVLFSLSILLLLGVAWTLRQALPRYWYQVQLFPSQSPSVI